MDEFCLPRVLAESEDFAFLQERQQIRFGKRLAFVQGVLLEAASWMSAPEGLFQDFADGLELDLGAAISASGSGEEQVSNWFVHSSWTLELNSGQLVSHLSNRAILRLDEALLSLASSQDEITSWLAQEVDVALSTFDELEAAQTFDQAIASLIAIDAFVGRLLVSLSKWRLWLSR